MSSYPGVFTIGNLKQMRYILPEKRKMSRSQRASIAMCMAALLILGVNAVALPSERTKAIAIGAITGAVIGHEIDDDHGALLGATIGAITGAAAARYQDSQRRELEALRARQHAPEIEIEQLQEEIIAVRLRNTATFDIDSCEIKPAFHNTLESLANSFVRYEHTFIHIIGHTDDSGSQEYNDALSFRRAEAVALFLISRGVEAQRLRIVGLGENEPRRPNDSDLHRQWNRRVELYIRPIIEGDEQSALYLPGRLSNVH